MDLHPIQGGGGGGGDGSRNTPSGFMLLKQEMSPDLMGHLVRLQTLFITEIYLVCLLFVSQDIQVARKISLTNQ